MEFGNRVIVIDYSEDRWMKYSVPTTEALLDKIQELADRQINVGFWDNSHVNRPIMRRSERQPFDFSSLPEYYVLLGKQGYFVKRSSRRICFAQNVQSTHSAIRKFKTEKAAQKYLTDNQKFFSGCAFTVECVQNGGASE